MRECFQNLAKEIVEYVFHPKRLSRMANQYGLDVAEYMDFI
jgi:hypothetical protein